MLVVASMLIWGTHVSGLQFFGYGIALSGMIYYKLGYDTLKNYTTDAQRHWAELGATRPALRKAIVILSAVLLIFAFFGGLAPEYSPFTFSKAADQIGLTST
jgi:hypothetical protein